VRFQRLRPKVEKVFAPLFSKSGRFSCFACPDQKSVVYEAQIKPDLGRVALKRPPFLLDFAL
jgi:hypothetical protein